jgi:hypothetical protein
MANISAAAPTAPGEFRIAQVFSQSSAVLSRHFLLFFVVALVASLPRVLMETTSADFGDTVRVNTGWHADTVSGFLIGVFLAIILNALAQAVLLYGAFQDMRGRPVISATACESVSAASFPSSGSRSACRSAS